MPSRYKFENSSLFKKSIMNSFRILLVIALCVASAAAVRSFGKCSEDYQTQDNFDLARYTGDWYQIARDKNFFFGNGECVTATYVQDVQRPTEAFVLN